MHYLQRPSCCTLLSQQQPLLQWWQSRSQYQQAAKNGCLMAGAQFLLKGKTYRKEPLLLIMDV